jgi:cell division septum initiation protein DivIVA
MFTSASPEGNRRTNSAAYRRVAMVDDAPPPPSTDAVPRPTARSNRVYSADAVDEYVAQLHEHAEVLQGELDQLTAELARVSPELPALGDEEGTGAGDPVAGLDDVVVLARKEAAALLEAAREQAAEVLAEGERLAAAAVIRALEHIDGIVREWADRDGPATTASVIDLREGLSNRRR